MLATSTADTDKYVQSSALDGVARTQSWLPETFVQNGGTIAVVLGPNANSGWATAPGDLPRDHVS